MVQYKLSPWIIHETGHIFKNRQWNCAFSRESYWSLVMGWRLSTRQYFPTCSIRPTYSSFLSDLVRCMIYIILSRQTKFILAWENFISYEINCSVQQIENFITNWAFSVAGPSVWNLLPDYLRDPAVSRDTFCKHLKTFLFAVYWYTFSALEVVRRCAI